MRSVWRLSHCRLPASPLWSPFRAGSRRCLASTADDQWQTVIGLEIHAQIRTDRKLFSGASFAYADPANTNVELLDAAIPGSLPVLNRHAIRLSLLTALALQCIINPRSTFDRKHYFYHDIPASYQITQHYNPLARNGSLSITNGENGVQRSFKVGIQQLQVEQDTAKSQLVGDERLVDLNRAGTALMEIVTDPDMRSAEEAGAFVRKLQSLLRRVGSGDGDMEKGNLRIDANVSMNKKGEPFGTRCEVKNLNSVRYLQQAILSERKRHIEHYTLQPDVPLERETRGLNEVTGETYSLRSKEDAPDYRYMPDSNLPAMVVDHGYLEMLKSSLPEFPWDTVDRLTSAHDLQRRDVETLVGLDEFEAQGVKYYEEVRRENPAIAKKALNWIVHEFLGQLKKASLTWTPEIVPTSVMRDLVMGVDDGSITGPTGKAVIRHLVHLPDPPSPTTNLASLLAELNLDTAAASSEDLRELCEKAITACPESVEAIRKGKQSAVGRIIGEVMKLSKGTANPKEAGKIVHELLKSP